MSALRFVVWSVAFIACVVGAFLYGFWLRPEGPPDRPTQISFIAASPDDFHRVAIAGARDAAEEFGAVVEVQTPANSQEQSTMIAGVDKELTDGVVVSILSPRTQTRMLSRLAVRVPVVTYDNDAPQSLRSCYIGTDNYLGGQLAARIVKEALPDGGELAIFIGDVERNNAVLRRLGFFDELLGRPRSDEGRLDPVDLPVEGAGYTIVGTFLDGHDEARCRENVVRALAEHEDLDALVGLYGYCAPICASVVQETGKQDAVKIVGFDQHEATLDGIEQGLIAGTVVQDPYQYGYQSVRLLSSWRQDRFTEPSKGSIAPELIPCRRIGPDNLAEFRQQVEKHLATADAGEGDSE